LCFSFYIACSIGISIFCEAFGKSPILSQHKHQYIDYRVDGKSKKNDAEGVQTPYISAKLSVMHPVDELVLNFSPSQMTVLNLAMAFLMFSVALDVKIDDFRRVLEYPRSILIGLSIQLFLFPLLTLAIIYVFRPPVSIALGMVLVSCCPSGNITNFLVHRAGANIALSVSLNAIIILLATVSTPIGFYFWSDFVPNTAELRRKFEIPFLDMAAIIVQLIAAPLVLGMLLNRRFPDLTQKIKKTAQTLSLIIFFAIIILAVAKNWVNLVAYLSYVFWLVAMHNALGLGTGYAVGRVFRLPENDARTLAFEAGVHNTALGMILIFNFFDGLGGMILLAAWWGTWDLVTGYGLAEWFRRNRVV
jgi:bile acid:Na+ symporter, BASS family